jgi:hypothetical protein
MRAAQPAQVTLSKKLSDTAKPPTMLGTGGFAFSPYDVSWANIVWGVEPLRTVRPNKHSPRAIALKRIFAASS